MEVILYSKECNWYTRCCPLNGGVCYRECPLYRGYTVSLIKNQIKMIKSLITDSNHSHNG